MTLNHDDPAAAARTLIETASRAYLGSLADRGETFPFVSLVLPGRDGTGRPLLLLSDLSDHAKNLKRDPHASLLYDGTAGLAEPLTGARVYQDGQLVRRPRRLELQDHTTLSIVFGRLPDNFGLDDEAGQPE